jgi:hypothetical protein
LTELKGAKWVSFVVYVTMPLPVIILLVIAIKGIGMEGSGDGIN